jgi:transcriptional regulator with XRE-family HTH domain
MNVGDRLRELRLEKGYSQRELARRAGIASNSVAVTERGEHAPTFPTIQKLARALDVDPGELFKEPAPLAAAPKTGQTEVEERPSPSLDQVRDLFAPLADGLKHYCARWEEKLPTLQGTREEVMDFFLDLQDFDAIISAVYEDELRAIALALDLGNRYGESGLPRDMAVGFTQGEMYEHSLMRRALKRYYAVGHALAQSIGDDERAETMQRMEQAYA